MSVTSLSMTLKRRHSVRLWASRSEDWACLAILGGDLAAEIRLEREHVEALREQAPGVLAGMDRTVAEDGGCQRAGIAEQRAVDAAAKALDMALAADAAGASEVAERLRECAAMATECANAVDATVRAFEQAAIEADSATDSLLYVTREADAALRRVRNDDRPAALVER